MWLCAREYERERERAEKDGKSLTTARMYSMCVYVAEREHLREKEHACVSACP